METLAQIELGGYYYTMICKIVIPDDVFLYYDNSSVTIIAWCLLTILLSQSLVEK